MIRDPRHDILYEPIQIGPVVAKNRFYQVPHCNGMGWLRPRSLAAMREVKAEGGWGVICTEYNSIHPTADDLPHPYATLWNDSDIRAHRLMTDKVHEHGALAGAELSYHGRRSANLMTREVAMDCGSFPNMSGHPYQTRAMDKADIRQYREWHKKAALRAKEAEFDILYVYATHHYLLANFLDPRLNTRGDEYGGSLENRVRLTREVIEDTIEAVGDRCAVAVRFAADERTGEDGNPILGERREMFEMLANLPDLWDINIDDYSLEMGVSRFTKEAALEPYMNWVRSVTDKPVVTVGRFTSPDTMVSQIKRGITDFVGAARPSIADPYIPNKIWEGRPEDIRECIGCNICYSGDSLGVPIRCTQNPTMGEEWRKDWHPEKIAPKHAEDRVLVVGAGPAGLETARALGERGYEVMLAEATRDLGGRVTRESRLPGMSEYVRVRDYREQQLLEMPNVEIFRESRLSAQDIRDVEPNHVVLATGASWRRERFDDVVYRSVASDDSVTEIYTPDDIMDGKLPPKGPVVIYDEDNYYMGGVIAERVRQQGVEVIYVTQSDIVSAWAEMTSEGRRIRTHMMKLGIKMELAHSVDTFDGETVTLTCEYSDGQKHVPAAAVVLVTQRVANDDLYHELMASVDGDADELPFTLKRIGDAEAPAIIAAAVYSGHRYARELGEPYQDPADGRFDRVDVGDTAEAPQSREITDEYLSELRNCYQAQIMASGQFQALAELAEDTDARNRMQLVSDAMSFSASAIHPLLKKYSIESDNLNALVETGRRDASTNVDLTAQFAGRLDKIAMLETLAPQADKPRVKLLATGEQSACIAIEPNGPEVAALLTYLGRR